MTIDELIKDNELFLKDWYRVNIECVISNLKQMMQKETEGEKAMDLAIAIHDLEIVLQEQF